MVFDQRSDKFTPEPVVFGAEVKIPKRDVARLLAELEAIEIPPFVPVSTFGIDGVSFGIEYGQRIASASISWWGDPPEPWKVLAFWHARTLEAFQDLLPASTVEQKGYVL